MSNKTVVIYKSRYGSTKKYAEWIAEAVDADLFEKGKINAEDLQKYDTIVFGGNVHAGRISGKEFIVDNFAKIADKNIIIFYVGSSIVNDKAIVHFKSHFAENIRDRIKLFGLRGAFNSKKLGFIDTLMMFVFKSILKSKKPEKLTEDERGLLFSCENPTDFIDKNSIAPIVSAIMAFNE